MATEKKKVFNGKKLSDETPIKKDKENQEEVVENDDGQIDVDSLSVVKAKELLKQYISDNAILEESLLKCQQTAEDNHNDYLRARADCENVRKRKAEDVRNAYDEGRLEAITKILPIGDSLDWALKMPLDEKSKEGIEMLLKKYHETLSVLGVSEYSPELGSEFDPNTAAAVMQVEPESEEDKSGTVKQVYGRGFKLGTKVIRYAQVSVVR